MTSKNDGGPAFPIPQQAMYGMTLRDWFAGQALTGLLANNQAERGTKETGDALADVYAQSAYRFADAMLKERSK